VRPHWPAALWIAAGALFILLATANGATYRYGGSDQAFYIPAVTKALHPDAFPRDASLIAAQARLIIVDELMAGFVRVTGASLDTLFFVGYLLSFALVWAAIVAIGTTLTGSPWGAVAIGAAFTLRHRISQTSANSFEPYFHPRMLAFSLGLLAIVAVLRRRPWVAIGLVAVAALIHVTTAIWFAVLLGVGIFVVAPRLRPLVAGGAVAAAVFLVWAVKAGPLGASWVTMDDVWLQAVASKDSLFADQWPAWAWFANLGLLALLWGAHLARRRRGVATVEDTGLVLGATALVALFLLTFPFVLARNAFVVEFQISRVFWLVDFLALAYLVAAIGAARPHAARAVALVLLAISVGRAGYVIFIEHPERPLVALHVPASPWEDAMEWLARQPLDIQVLADPGHAWKYGTSVRVSASRDVFLEEVKDAALAIYSHDVAARVVERTRVIGDFSQLTAEKARSIASRYDVDYLVTTAELPLPLAYRNSEFQIYALR
jgi:hypothetical protein